MEGVEKGKETRVDLRVERAKDVDAENKYNFVRMSKILQILVTSSRKNV